MELVSFPEQTTVITKDQPEYRPMPAHVAADGTVTCCWQLSPLELAKVRATGCIWHQVLTFGSPLQPQLLSVDRPDLPAAPG